MSKKKTQPTLADALRREARYENHVECLAGLVDPQEQLKPLPSFAELAQQASKAGSRFVKLTLPAQP